jgi:hypothetical protein
MTKFFEEHPGFAGRILREYTGVQLPLGTHMEVVPGTVNTRPSDDLQPDKVIAVRSKTDPERIIIVEVQQDEREEKRRQWARYAAALWVRHDCPVDVLVICPDQDTADWYARPYETTLDRYAHWPRVLMPSRVPALTTPEEMAADPETAVLSVAYHGRNRAVTTAFVEGMIAVGSERGERYYNDGFRIAPSAIRAIMEGLMATTYEQDEVSSPFFRRLRAEGRAEGRAEALLEAERDKILLTLELRGLEVADEQRYRIAGCSDLPQLQDWTKAARTATEADDLFD